MCIVYDNVVWQGCTGMCGEDVPKGEVRVSVSCKILMLYCAVFLGCRCWAKWEEVFFG